MINFKKCFDCDGAGFNDVGFDEPYEVDCLICNGTGEITEDTTPEIAEKILDTKMETEAEIFYIPVLDIGNDDFMKMKMKEKFDEK